MIKAPIPANKVDRLADLRALDRLDTPSESRFDHLTELVARVFNVPIAWISRINADRQWFKAKCGDIEATPKIVGIGLESPPERGKTPLRSGEEL